MWLATYGMMVCGEWRARGYADGCLEKIMEIAERIKGHNLRPSWLGDERLHASHRAALLAKSPEWYGQWGWTEEAKIEYWWPGGHSTQG